MKKNPTDAPKASQEVVSGLTRFTRHHLPWDRFSRWKSRRAMLVRPSIVANNPDLDDLVRQTWSHLKDLNQTPFLFRRDGRLCRIEADDTGIPVPVSVDVQRMNFCLVELIDWVKQKNGELINTRPPKDVAPHLVADPDPPVPPLQRIVTAPIFAASGLLLDEPGAYVDDVLYLPPKRFRLDPPPVRPSSNEIHSAVNFLTKNLLSDFCLVGESEMANCLAALITPVVREMIHGSTPLFWIDKSTGGSGGTLLSSVIAAPLLGAAPSGVTAPRDEAEWMRVILSTLRRSPNVFFIDNCNGYLSSEALASAITADRYQGRIIGSSDNEAADVRCLWLINGNNLRFGWELARRVVRIRIDPGVAPDQRDRRDFLHPNLLSWVIEHRAEILFHIIVLVNAWLSSGRPRPSDETPSFGSFDSWRDVVGGILETAGVEGFLLNLEDARQQADQESGDLRAFLEAWQLEFGVESLFATDLLRVARQFFELQGPAQAASIRLGLILKKYENQTLGGLRIQRLPTSHGKTPWRLQPAAKE